MSAVLDGVPAVKHGTGLDIASGPAVAFTLRHNTNGSGSSDNAWNTTYVPVAFDWQKGGGGNDHSWRGKSREWIERAGDYAGSLSATKHDAIATWDERNITSQANRTRVEFGSPANTLHAEGLSLVTPMAVRRLTPLECERLQGWPDRHTELRADGSLIPDGPRYRMIGNGVAAPVAAWLGRRLRAALEAS